MLEKNKEYRCRGFEVTRNLIQSVTGYFDIPGHIALHTDAKHARKSYFNDDKTLPRTVLPGHATLMFLDQAVYQLPLDRLEVVAAMTKANYLKPVFEGTILCVFLKVTNVLELSGTKWVFMTFEIRSQADEVMTEGVWKISLRKPGG